MFVLGEGTSHLKNFIHSFRAGRPVGRGIIDYANAGRRRAGGDAGGGDYIAHHRHVGDQCPTLLLYVAAVHVRGRGDARGAGESGIFRISFGRHVAGLRRPDCRPRGEKGRSRCAPGAGFPPQGSLILNRDTISPYAQAWILANQGTWDDILDEMEWLDRKNLIEVVVGWFYERQEREAAKKKP